ncbi:hypothetical protein C8R43DRAFT_1128635 [Mycena crocata]|nr:hypothetical protein C8R43DRAFT_1128635 [Mycena crocata]
MDNNPFNKTEWIGKGIKWAATLPSHVRKAAGDELSLPQTVEAELIPACSLSIAKMIQFPLPVQIPTVSSCIVSDFFSKEAPGRVTADILLRLRHLPIPDTKLIRKLQAELRQAWLDGFQSVPYTHIAGTVTTHFPLWLITYWNEVLDIRLNVRQYWMRGQKWVHGLTKKKGHTGYRSESEQTSILLGTLPWGLTKPSDGEQFNSLYRFLGPHWLASSQLDDMLEIECLKINTTPELVKNMRVRGVDLTNYIVKAYEARETEDYMTARELDWLRILAEDLLGNQASLLTAANLERIVTEPEPYKRWIALVVDASEGLIQYGDGYGRDDEIPAKLIAAYTWWLGHHSSMEFKTGKLPITRQMDGFSCGILALNGLSHYADPSVPLLDSGKWEVARLKAFNAIAERALERVAMERALAIAADEDSDDYSNIMSAAQQLRHRHPFRVHPQSARKVIRMLPAHRKAPRRSEFIDRRITACHPPRLVFNTSLAAMDEDEDVSSDGSNESGDEWSGAEDDTDGGVGSAGDGEDSEYDEGMVWGPDDAEGSEPPQSEYPQSDYDDPAWATDDFELSSVQTTAPEAGGMIYQPP